jgi:ABC-type sugar transport system ATPase subunit
MIVRQGEVVGLIGENGAGKSTLLNVLCGVVKADRGRMSVRGEPYAPDSYAGAMGSGVFRVYQEPALIPTLRVKDNLVLGLEKSFTRAGFLNERAINRAAADALSMVGDLVDPDRMTGSYDANVRQVVEIVRAMFAASVLGVEHPLILLDEPTAALLGAEIDVLFHTIARARGRAAFVFVSHRLNEIQDIADRSYVLKDGRVVAEVGTGVSANELHELMVGRQRADDYYAETRQREDLGRTVLDVRRLTGPRFRDVSFLVRAGEIVSIAGVVGSGKEELGRVLAGDLKRDSGEIALDDVLQSRDQPSARFRAGLGYIPRDRYAEGIISAFDVASNLSLAALEQRRFGRPFLSPRAERRVAEEWRERLGIRASSVRAGALTLSGGNQQKIVISKVLQTGARVLVFDNPTRGVDAGTKSEIYALLRELTEGDIAMVLISDDLPEAIGLANRVLVMKDGEVAMEFDARAERKPREVDLIAACV